MVKIKAGGQQVGDLINIFGFEISHAEAAVHGSDYPGFQQGKASSPNIQLSLDPYGKGALIGNMANHKTLQDRNPKGFESFLKYGLQAEAVGPVGLAFGELAQNNPGHLFQLAGQPEVGEHAIDAIGFFSHILKNQDLTFEIRLEGGTHQLDQQREVAANQAASCLTPLMRISRFSRSINPALPSKGGG